MDIVFLLTITASLTLSSILAITASMLALTASILGMTASMLGITTAILGMTASMLGMIASTLAMTGSVMGMTASILGITTAPYMCNSSSHQFTILMKIVKGFISLHYLEANLHQNLFNSKPELAGSII